MTTETEVENARGKLQRQLIENCGAKEVELWIDALKMLKYTRGVLVQLQPTLQPAQATISTISAPGKTMRRSLLSEQLQKKRQEALNQMGKRFPYETSSITLGKLPQRIWRQIILLAGDAYPAMSELQWRSVTTYAMDRNTVKSEMGRTHMAESAQIWTVLQEMGCLMYEMRQ